MSCVRHGELHEDDVRHFLRGTTSFAVGSFIGTAIEQRPSPGRWGISQNLNNRIPGRDNETQTRMSRPRRWMIFGSVRRGTLLSGRTEAGTNPLSEEEADGGLPD